MTDNRTEPATRRDERLRGIVDAFASALNKLRASHPQRDEFGSVYARLREYERIATPTLRAPAIDSLEALRANIEFVEANDPDFEHATFVVSHGVAQTMCSVATVYADEVKAYLERHSVTETTGREVPNA